MTDALFCRDFRFSFADAVVLDKISFGLGTGDCLSVIGPNGAGKSTLLKSFLRLHETGRSEGTIHIHGRPLASFSQRELARLVAYVPQAGGRIPPFTAVEFLMLSRYPHASRQTMISRADREEIERALALTGTENLGRRRLDTLSGGERQKIFLAAALAQGANILLLDEPASFLDPRHEAEMNALLCSLNRERGLTMITVTHDLNHPLDIGGLVLVLRRGKQLYFGPVAALAAEGILEEAFGHTFTHLTHPKTGDPLVLPDRLRGAS